MVNSQLYWKIKDVRHIPSKILSKIKKIEEGFKLSLVKREQEMNMPFSIII